MGKLQGKVALITGAARGQGEAEARLFIEEGAQVVLGDLRDDLGKRVAESLGSAAIYMNLDVGREEARRGEWQMFINRGAHFAADPNQVSPYTSCDTFYPNGANLSWYCRPELDVLWAQGLEGVTPEERAPTYEEAFRFLNADPDVISLYWPDTIVAQASSLTGVDPVGQPEHVTWNIADWGWAG